VRPNLKFLVFNFQTVVFFQQASGLWSDQLLYLLKGYPTLKDLVDKQDEQLKKLSLAIILTLVGIKLLRTYFMSNIKEWRFVAAKGIKQVKEACVSGVSVDGLCDRVVFEVAFK